MAFLKTLLFWLIPWVSWDLQWSASNSFKLLHKEALWWLVAYRTGTLCGISWWWCLRGSLLSHCSGSDDGIVTELNPWSPTWNLKWLEIHEFLLQGSIWWFNVKFHGLTLVYSVPVVAAKFSQRFWPCRIISTLHDLLLGNRHAQWSMYGSPRPKKKRSLGWSM